MENTKSESDDVKHRIESYKMAPDPFAGSAADHYLLLDVFIRKCKSSMPFAAILTISGKRECSAVFASHRLVAPRSAPHFLRRKSQPETLLFARSHHSQHLLTDQTNNTRHPVPSTLINANTLPTPRCLSATPKPATSPQTLTRPRTLRTLPQRRRSMS